MNYFIRSLAFAAAALCVAGCKTSRPCVYVPENEQVREVANCAARDLLGSPTFHRYLESFRSYHNGEKPVLKFANIVNKTHNLNIDMAVVHDVLFEALHDSDTVVMIDSRQNVDMLAADIVLRLRAMSSELLDGSVRRVEHRIIFEIFDCKVGENIWAYAKDIGYAIRR